MVSTVHIVANKPEFWLLKNLSDTESDGHTVNSDEDFDETYEPVGGAFAIAFESPENQETLEPFIDLTEQEQKILLEQYSKKSVKFSTPKYWFSPMESFKGLRTRSQRSLKKHHNSALFEAIDSLLYSLKFSRFSNGTPMRDKKSFSLDDFLSDYSTTSELCATSTISPLITIIFAESDLSDNDDEGASNSSNNEQLIVCFDFEDSFRRHLLHAITEFYDMVSFSRMCYHGRFHECFCQRGVESPTHRVTLVHCRKPESINSESSSSSSLSPSFSNSSYLSSSSSSPENPIPLSQFLKAYSLKAYSMFVSFCDYFGLLFVVTKDKS